MDKGVTCEHLNKLADVLDKDLWHSKETLACYDCGCPGPNLWICLQPNCYHVGCSEVKNDHSTIHQKNYPTHCVHMNVSTERIWCYLCEKEVHIRAATAHIALGPDTTSLDGSGFSSRVGSPGLVSAEEDIDPDDMDYDDDSRPRGLVGLQNMGNTCYMNAALQALSNTAPLTSYFLECSAYISILAGDKKPALSRAYQKLMKEMWSPKTRGYVVPNGILYGIRNVHPMFRGYQQHDTQEFLRCFMDQLHEELKEPVNDSAEEDRLISDADGDHQEPRNYTRRRAASSGASDAPFFSRNRRKSPAASSYSESRTDGYLRVHQDMASSKHRRSASFGGTQLAYNVFTQHQVNGPDNQRDRDMGSESELSGSSEADERYETCSSGASDTGESTTKPGPSYSGGGDSASSNIKYRSIVSDVFDGKLLSSVQCLICNRVSRRVETFQDLSLPIPSRDQVSALRHQQHPLPPSDHDSWLWWLVSWFRSWFYGPAVSLQDCLAAFFSADELKGDNMYSCSRCNKLRNGIKSVGAVRLPEVLCVHLKRFRHELMFSAKVAARVSFPIHHLDMSPYMHPECKSKISSYSLCAVISHAGTAGGGHYTCAARQRAGWFLYDDHAVTPLHHHHLPNMEAYVLFYRKVNPQMAALRQKAAEILQSSCLEQNDIKFYISKQWINKFNTWAEPGAIDNSDFACSHGGVRPDRAAQLHTLCALLPQPLWQMLHDKFGGGPAVSHIHECAVCARAARKLRTRRTLERNTFYRLHHAFQEQENPRCIYGISMRWFREWQAFVRNKAPRPPPPVDNEGILTKQEVDGKMVYVLKPGSDHAQISGELWRFFIETYGGGPEVKLKCPSTHQCTAQQTVFNQTRDSQTFTDTRMSSKQSESDKEDYCVTTDNIQRLQKNQSLQNLQHKQYNEEITIPPYNGEANGNYDSDEDMDRLDSIPNQVINQPITMPVENGIDSSDHDANDNPVNKQTDKTSEHPNDMTVKKSKTGKVRKYKRSAFAYFNSFTD